MAIALITGAPRGLGLEVARQLAVTGVDVVIAARDPQVAVSAAGELKGVHRFPRSLDVADPESVHVAAHSWAVDIKQLDILINNAAAYVDWSEVTSTADLDSTERVMQVNLFGGWRMIQAFLPLLMRSPHPRIVNVSSGAGSHADPAFGLRVRGGAAATYGISKAAVNALTSTLAAELSRTPVIVNAVCPGLTATYPSAEAMGAAGRTGRGRSRVGSHAVRRWTTRRVLPRRKAPRLVARQLRRWASAPFHLDRAFCRWREDQIRAPRRCPVSRHKQHMSQDIGNTAQLEYGRVESPPGHYCGCY
jgi:NAD(P)-dependent dehydrogenase (short-subunit alcohol dehydrogenase family)